MAYNHQTVRFHEPKPCMNPTVIAGLTSERQRLFRDVWSLGRPAGEYPGAGDPMRDALGKRAWDAA
jgi:hypothetical protein